jgi:hypothetical protein
LDRETLATAYLNDVLRTYRNYKALGEKAIGQISHDTDLHIQLDPESNSIAIIVKHLTGNLRSRFRDFLHSDGEKPDRRRDDEFEMPERVSRDEMMRWWDEAWTITLASIEALQPEDIERTVHIRGEALLVMEALNRNAAHSAYHVGQIVYLARHFANSNWKSLAFRRVNRSSSLQAISRQRGSPVQTGDIDRFRPTWSRKVWSFEPPPSGTGFSETGSLPPANSVGPHPHRQLQLDRSWPATLVLGAKIF